MTPAFPEFYTPLCNLRCIRQDDIAQVFAGLSHPRVIEFYGVSYPDLAATQAQMDWYARIAEEKSGIWWAIARPEDDVLIGACGFCEWEHAQRSIELGYWLLPDYWGRGLLQEIIPRITQYALRTLQVHRIYAEVEPENIPSCKLLEKLGFIYEGTSRDCEWADDHFISLKNYSLLSHDPAAQVWLQDKGGMPARAHDAEACQKL